MHAARMISKYLDGILRGVPLAAINVAAKSMNARIPRIKVMVYGYRNREHFRNLIRFHLGVLDLDLSPA